MFKHVFDLDNTLVFTDNLNSEAYNHALSVLGREPIFDVGRITREVVYSKHRLSEHEKNILVKTKQKYFLDNIGKIKVNEDLVNLLLSLSSSECVLWTSADECRVKAILDYLKLSDAFTLVFYSKKTNIKADAESVCQYFQCSKSQLKFYEDDAKVMNELKLLGICNILKVYQ